MNDGHVNQKITQALERISKAFRVLLWKESKKHGISPIQIQILVFCLSHKPEMLKVSFLAKDFDGFKQQRKIQWSHRRGIGWW